MNTHDEFSIVVPVDKAEEAQKVLIECMTSTPDWMIGLPLKCDSNIAQAYGDVK